MGGFHDILDLWAGFFVFYFNLLSECLFYVDCSYFRV